VRRSVSNEIIRHFRRQTPVERFYFSLLHILRSAEIIPN
jgi:hypothetical protein